MTTTNGEDTKLRQMDTEAARIREVVRQWAQEIREREAGNGKD